jgi:Mg2+ and Co2+ transporter CorA
VSVDNRYTGVGYGPPFETPSDKDFMASHIESLESRVRELEEEREMWSQHTVDALRQCDELRARHAALVEVANSVHKIFNGKNYRPYSYETIALNKLKAALAEVK